MAENINNSIKVWRAARDMTQEELARRVGVTRQTIIAIEKNRYAPSLELAFRIARVFGESVENVFRYEEGGEAR
ncbi:MAG TPA: helix-turn-helix transcriptional regulator [bacterium]|nr:MAG: antitoxin HipB [bacterium ADurb.Bin236]HOY63600.1 helix-turn-helix transcriptional regulator [bacterium]HPI77523.1 helix-turn-helix transcriptional regulator [bacterium]